MIKLLIKGIGTDSDLNPPTSRPANSDQFDEVVAVNIGKRAGKASDLFMIRVCTPAGLAQREATDGILAAYPLMVMRRFERNELMSWLEPKVASCEAATWEECVERLRLYFDYEYSYAVDAPPPGPAREPLRLAIRIVRTASAPNLRGLELEDPEIFTDIVAVEIGTKPADKTGMFKIRVATPAALARMPDQHGVIAERPLVVVSRFEFNSLSRWLQRVVRSCQAATWNECVAKLRHHFEPEFPIEEHGLRTDSTMGQHFRPRS